MIEKIVSEPPRLETLPLFSLANATDQLGVFRFHNSVFYKEQCYPVFEGVRKFIPTRDNLSYSKGYRYFALDKAILSSDSLIEACRSPLILAEDKMVACALYENLTNLTMGLINYLWDYCTTDHYSGNLVAILTSLIETTTNIARVHIELLYGLEPSANLIDWQWIAWILNSFSVKSNHFRTFREIDNKVKIIDEILFLRNHVIDEFKIQSLLFPLYGALSLGVYWSAYDLVFFPNDAKKVFYAKVGYHDQGGIHYTDHCGGILIERIMPVIFREKFKLSIREQNILVVDDNFARADTLSTCRKLIDSYGGLPFCRSVESSWSYFKHVKCSSTIADIVDFPSLRTYFHHSKQAEMLGLISNDHWEQYEKNIDYMNRLPHLALQMCANLHNAIDFGIWKDYTVSMMCKELDFALSFWLEKSMPEKKY